MKISLVLPYPPKELSPNFRIHWTKKIKYKDAQRDAGYYEAFKYRGVFGKENLKLSLLFIPKTNRRHDCDNALASEKAGLDGVAKGLGIDDKQFRPIFVDFGNKDKINPRVEVTISDD
jgi:crossover junction endodeoxyribonuclease RusA